MKTYELKTKQICYFTFLVEAESEQEALDTLDDGYVIDEELGPAEEEDYADWKKWRLILHLICHRYLGSM